MKKTFTYSAFLFVVLFATTLVSNAQSPNSNSKQQTTTQQVAQPVAFFNVASLDDARNKMEDAYVKYQNAAPEQSDALGAEFRHLRRMYLVTLQKESVNYPSTTETGAKIHSEMLRADKDLR